MIILTIMVSLHLYRLLINVIFFVILKFSEEWGCFAITLIISSIRGSVVLLLFFARHRGKIARLMLLNHNIEIMISFIVDLQLLNLLFLLLLILRWIDRLFSNPEWGKWSLKRLLTAFERWRIYFCCQIFVSASSCERFIVLYYVMLTIHIRRLIFGQLKTIISLEVMRMNSLPFLLTKVGCSKRLLLLDYILRRRVLIHIHWPLLLHRLSHLRVLSIEFSWLLRLLMAATNHITWRVVPWNLKL